MTLISLDALISGSQIKFIRYLLRMVVQDELTYKVIGCCLKVHNTLGNGFQEVIYQRCLAIEFDKAQVSFAREIEQTIHYEGHDVGTRRADFIVENKVIIELKARYSIGRCSPCPSKKLSGCL